MRALAEIAPDAYAESVSPHGEALMRPVLTITMNPALDVSAETPTLLPDRKLRCAATRLDPGGGGVNVSRAINRLGGSSTAFVALGGPTGGMIADLLAGEGIKVAVFSTDGLTRQSFAVTVTDTGRQYRFVLPGPQWQADATRAMLDALSPLMTERGLVVVSGSLPPGVRPDGLAEIKDLCASRKADLLLDTSGPALIETVRGHSGAPYHLLRVDGQEAEDLAGHQFAAPEELVAFGRELVCAKVADHLVMALGAEGTAGVSASDAFFCRPPLVDVVSAVGAGDSMLAAIALTLARGESFRAAVRAGTAAAAAAVMTPATELCDGKTAVRLIDDTRVIEIGLAV